jgi:hypothetical protein
MKGRRVLRSEGIGAFGFGGTVRKKVTETPKRRSPIFVISCYCVSVGKNHGPVKEASS